MLRIAEFPSTVKPAEVVRLVRERGVYKVQRITAKGHVARNMTHHVDEAYARSFVEAARANGAIYARLSDHEPEDTGTRPAVKGSTRWALERLLREKPNEVITKAIVASYLGHGISRSALSKAARIIARDEPLVMRYGSTGGCVLCKRVPHEGEEPCAICHYNREGRCLVIGDVIDRPRVRTCGGWRMM